MALAEDASDDYRYILEVIAPRLLERFVVKSKDYDDAYKLLGAKGQFSDINRKFWKLHKSIWLGQELKGEQPAECAEDIVGHCLLLLLLLDRERSPDRADFSSRERLVPPTLPASESARLERYYGRCEATVGGPDGEGRCELYLGHESPHLTEIGTVKQRQWGERVA